jgi:hypothetical protein
MCIFILSVYVVLLCVRAVLTALMYYLDAGLLTRSQYPEGPATDQFGTGFSWFSWVLEQMLGWFPYSFPSCRYMLPM